MPRYESFTGIRASHKETEVSLRAWLRGFSERRRQRLAKQAQREACQRMYISAYAALDVGDWKTYLRQKDEYLRLVEEFQSMVQSK